MATLDEESAARVALGSVLNELNAINAESLVRSEVLGELNFRDGVAIFKRSLELYRDLSECNLDRVPFEALRTLSQQAQSLFDIFRQIKSFSIAQHPQNPAQVRDSLINQVRDRWGQDYNVVAPHIAFAIRQGTDFAALEREARGTLTLQKQIISDLQTEKGKILAEMGGALDRVRQAAAEAGVAQHAIHFKEEAESHNEQSKRWLYSAIAFGCAMLAYAAYLMLSQLATVGPVDIHSYLHLMLPKITILLVLVFGLVWSARNYSSSRHNFVVNRHRQNALSSFETFVKGAGDAATKDAVLLQATQSIFAPQDTGYSKADVSVGPGSQIVEIVRGVSGAKPS